MGDKTDRATGALKETAGTATNDPRLVREGRREQAKGDMKKAGKKVKDALKKF
jgi:uncharacterized protein YjbJ (UPF0337 family)